MLYRARCRKMTARSLFILSVVSYVGVVPPPARAQDAEPRHGPCLGAGFGFSNYALEHGTGDPLEPVSDDPSYFSGTGWGYTLGVGWESLRIVYHYGKVGALRDPRGATVATGWRQNMLLVEFAGRGGPEPATVRAHADILNRSFHRPGICPAAVALFDAPSEVGKPYVEVAQ